MGSIWDKFIEKLQDVHHPYNTNICEGFNKFLTKFIPKNRTMNGTLEYETRLNLAVCINSIGYYETYEQIFEMMGMECSNNLSSFLFELDNRKK